MKNAKFAVCCLVLLFAGSYSQSLMNVTQVNAGNSRSDQALSSDMLYATVQILKRARSRDGGAQWYTAGSGFYLGDGYVATAHHVVQDYQEVQVKFNVNKFNARVTVDAKIELVFPAQDVAILYVDGAPRDLKVAKMSKDELQWGDPVIITGSPLGIRTAPTRGDYVGASQNYVFDKDYRWLMCDSFHGNSGGPVWNAKTGKVVGILVAGPDEYPVMSLMIPVKYIIDSFKAAKETHGKSWSTDGQ